MIEQAMENFNVTGNVDFVKLDCEGCEYDIVPALHSGIFVRFKHVEGETHPWLTQYIENKTSIREAEERMCARRWYMRNLRCVSEAELRALDAVRSLPDP